MAAETLTLRDGSRVLVRPIEPGDKPALEQGVKALGPESRYRRFFTPLKQLTPSQLRYLTEVDHHDHEALVAFDADSGEGVGVGRYVRDGPEGNAEVAITVIDDWQGRGLGTALLTRLADRAREEGIETFTGIVLTSNDAMLTLLRELGDVEASTLSAGVVELRVALPARSEGIGATLRHWLREAAGGRVQFETPWFRERPRRRPRS